MSDFFKKPHSRRDFMKYVGTGAAASVIGFPHFASSQEALTFGLAVPTSTYFGEAAEKAAQIAIQQINADGGVLGTPLDMIVEDSAGNAQQAQLSVQALDARGADFMGGFFFSEELNGALGTFGVTRKLFFGTGASTPAATVNVEQDYNNGKFFFRVGPANSLFILQSAVTFAIGALERGLGWDSIVLFAEEASWTQPITASFQTLLQAFGSSLQVVDVIRYDEGTTDFTPLFNRSVDAMRGKTGGIFTIMAHTGTRPTSQWAAQQVPLPFVGINVQAQDGRFNQLTNGAAESVVTFSGGAKAPITPLTIPFVEAFENSSINPAVSIPSYNAFYTYDAIRLFKWAVEGVEVLPDSEANTDAVIQQLESLDADNTFQVTTGNLSFYQRGETNVSLIQPQLSFPHDLRFGGQYGDGVWIQWNNGQQEVIFPPVAPDGQTELITAQFILPPWMQ